MTLNRVPIVALARPRSPRCRRTSSGSSAASRRSCSSASRRCWRRAHPARGRPGRRQDHARARAGALALARVPAHPVHQRSAAGGHRRRDDLQPGPAGVRVRLRADLHERPARRRDQPRHAEVAVGAARGDERGDDHDREAAPGAARSVPRHRHAESDRARRHVSAAGVAARPLPDEADHRLSERDRREEAPPRRRRAGGARASRSRCSTATKCASCRRASAACT